MARVPPTVLMTFASFVNWMFSGVFTPVSSVAWRAT